MPTNVLDRLIEMLCEERGERVPQLDEGRKPLYFRALCNVRPPIAAGKEFLALQDEYLTEQTRRRGIVYADGFEYEGGIALWRGDITRLACGAIVNACNCALLGCFVPLHGCIDNAIHSAAGVQVRLDCNDMMKGGTEPNGRVRVTKAYNLPCRYIFHTVGPIVSGRVTQENRRDLENCYLSCLEKADETGLESIAFCCISTGEYRYPKKEACRVAVGTVKDWKARTGSALKVIFNVFSEEDEGIYERELGKEG